MSLARQSLSRACGCLAAVLAVAAAAQPATPERRTQSLRDDQHDFDWEFGTWETKVRVLRNPLSHAAPPDWADYRGTSVVRPVAGGRFNLVDLSVQGPVGRIDGVSLRLYNPQSHRWTLNYVNVRSGMLTAPVEGDFDGRSRGVFLGTDTLDGRAIRVRFVITRISRAQAHFEQAFSADDGATWETNWVADDTLVGASGP